MKIAVNTGFLLHDPDGRYSDFIFALLDHIVRSQPQHHFILLFNKGRNKAYDFPQNVEELISEPISVHPLLRKYWVDVTIPRLLKKYDITLFLSCDGSISSATGVPQCLLLPDPSFPDYSRRLKKPDLVFRKRYMHKFLSESKSIITLSEYSKRKITGSYEVDEDKICVVPPAVNEIFHPLNDDAKHSLKVKLTDAKEYFAYTGAIDDETGLTNLLKAFSIFKKRQASNLKFVIASPSGEMNKRFVASLETYKYRDDVVLITHASASQLADITGAAYAMVNPSVHKDSTLPFLEAIQCHVPMIAPTDSAILQLAGDAALYVDPIDHNALAEKMMVLYKDENLRAGLINKDIEKAGEYSFQRSAAASWDCMIRALQS